MQIETPEPGWKATIYAAPPGAVPKSVPTGWTKVGGGTVTSKDKRFKLDTDGDALPLLPGLDHEARRRAPSARDLRDPACSQRVAAR